MPGAASEVMALRAQAKAGIPMAQCSATSRHGQQCKHPAIPGATVCPYHGGSAPQVREAARRRLLELVPDAVEAMAQMAGIIEGAKDVKDEVRQRAAADLLDRAGLRPSDHVVVTEQGLPNELLDAAIAQAMANRGMLNDGIEDAEIVQPILPDPEESPQWTPPSLPL